MNLEFIGWHVVVPSSSIVINLPRACVPVITVPISMPGESIDMAVGVLTHPPRVGAYPLTVMLIVFPEEPDKAAMLQAVEMSATRTADGLQVVIPPVQVTS